MTDSYRKWARFTTDQNIDTQTYGVFFLRYKLLVKSWKGLDGLFRNTCKTLS